MIAGDLKSVLYDTGATDGSYGNVNLLSSYPYLKRYYQPHSVNVIFGDGDASAKTQGILKDVPLELQLSNGDMKSLYIDLHLLDMEDQDIIIGLPDIVGDAYEAFDNWLKATRATASH